MYTGNSSIERENSTGSTWSRILAFFLDLLLKLLDFKVLKVVEDGSI
jgi:hypothetical protein